MVTDIEPRDDTPGDGAAGEGSRLQAWVDSNIGATVAEKYEVMRCLGTGGMGGVFLARHRLLPGSFFALKLMIPRPHCGPPDEQEKRFTREARTAMRFVHPRAAQVRDFGFDRERGVLYMAMDYVEGRRLDLVIAEARERDRPGTPVIETARALRITHLMLDVLRSAHAAGVIHRDLKPGNVILVGSGEEEDVRILDFGCAKMLDAASGGGPDGPPGERGAFPPDTITEKGIVMGTVQYMAPEQARGERLDPRADLYSVGVVLYEMLTGKIPHETRRHNLLILARALKPAIPLEQARPDVRFPAVVRAIVARAVEMRREDRFADASEFSCMVEEAIRETAPPPTRPCAAAPPDAEAPPAEEAPSTVEMPGRARRRPAAGRRALRAFAWSAAATAAAFALIGLGRLAWTRAAYSLCMARGRSALSTGDLPRAVESFERASRLRPDDTAARDLASKALAETALARADEEARLGNLHALRLHAARAAELGADPSRLRALEELVLAGTRVAEARRLAEARRFSRAKGLLDLLPDRLPGPWAAEASARRAAVDAELRVAARLLEDAERHASGPDRGALALAEAALAEFLDRFPDHPRREEAVLLRARVAGRIGGGGPAYKPR